MEFFLFIFFTLTHLNRKGFVLFPTSYYLVFCGNFCFKVELKSEDLNVFWKKRSDHFLQRHLNHRSSFCGPNFTQKSNSAVITTRVWPELWNIAPSKEPQCIYSVIHRQDKLLIIKNVDLKHSRRHFSFEFNCSCAGFASSGEKKYQTCLNFHLPSPLKAVFLLERAKFLCGDWIIFTWQAARGSSERTKAHRETANATNLTASVAPSVK